VEAAQIGGRPPPIDEPDREPLGPIAVGVVANALEGRLLVVAGRGGEAPPGRHDGGQAEAAAEFQKPAARPVHQGQLLGQDQRRLPHVRPIGNPLVGREGLLVDQRIDVGRAPEAVDGAPDVDQPLDRRKPLVVVSLAHDARFGFLIFRSP